jgi:hypothetical protein
MSLKAFHIFFIALSALLCVGIGAVRIDAFVDGAGTAALAQGVVALLSGVGLVVYGRSFLKKTKGLGYLVFALLALAPSVSEACSVCFGDGESAQGRAMKAGILVMLGIIGTVLSGFGGLFLYWMSRSRRLATMQDKGATV